MGGFNGGTCVGCWFDVANRCFWSKWKKVLGNRFGADWWLAVSTQIGKFHQKLQQHSEARYNSESTCRHLSPLSKWPSWLLIRTNRHATAWLVEDGVCTRPIQPAITICGEPFARTRGGAKNMVLRLVSYNASWSLSQFSGVSPSIIVGTRMVWVGGWSLFFLELEVQKLVQEQS